MTEDGNQLKDYLKVRNILNQQYTSGAPRALNYRFLKKNNTTLNLHNLYDRQKAGEKTEEYLICFNS